MLGHCWWATGPYPPSQRAQVRARLSGSCEWLQASFRVLSASHTGTGHLQQRAVPVIGDLGLQVASPRVGVAVDSDAHGRWRWALGTGCQGGDGTEGRRVCAPAGGQAEEMAGAPGLTHGWLELSSTHGLRKTLSRCVGDDAVSVTPVRFGVPSSQKLFQPCTGAQPPDKES